MDLKNEIKDESKFASMQEPCLELPSIHGMKKQLNQSPRRRIITLKLPKVELFGKETLSSKFPLSLISGKPQHSRVLSMSVDCRMQKHNSFVRSPIKSSFNNYQLNLENPQNARHKRLSSLQVRLRGNLKNFKAQPVKITSNEDILVRGQAKVMRESVVLEPISEKGLFALVKNFKVKVEEKYSKVFEDIDISKSGVIIFDDFINLIILISLRDSGEREDNYLAIRQKSIEMFSLFKSSSGRSKVHKSDFLAISSVFEYFFRESKAEDLLKFENIHFMQLRVNEMKQIFNYYAKEGVIDEREFKSILACIQIDDLMLIQGLLFAEPLVFSRFLVFLPVFLHVHKEILDASANV